MFAQAKGFNPLSINLLAVFGSTTGGHYSLSREAEVEAVCFGPPRARLSFVRVSGIQIFL